MYRKYLNTKKVLERNILTRNPAMEKETRKVDKSHQFNKNKILEAPSSKPQGSCKIGSRRGNNKSF